MSHILAYSFIVVNEASPLATSLRLSDSHLSADLDAVKRK